MKVGFSSETITETQTNNKEKLNSEGLDRAAVSLTQDNKYLLVEVGAFVPRNKFDSDDLSFVESVSKISITKPIKTKPIDGIELVGNTYQIKNASKDQVENALCSIASTKLFRCFISKITDTILFKANEKVNPEMLRNFKTKTDLQGKQNLFYGSTLKVSAEAKRITIIS